MFAHGKHTQFWPITIGTQEKTHETLRSRAIFNPNRFIASPLHGDNPKCTSSLPRALRLRNFGRSQMTLNARANKLRHAVLLRRAVFLQNDTASCCSSARQRGVWRRVARSFHAAIWRRAVPLHGDLASCGELKTWDWKMQHQTAGLEIARLEKAGLENARTDWLWKDDQA